MSWVYTTHRLEKYIIRIILLLIEKSLKLEFWYGKKTF